ncbi:YggU family protein (plasmid) [Candidatus Pantoea edessiphila]|uniref:UPF0235 protein CRV12_03745 n=1 Tax=Candidatus Pantoea edessiphila TaxID=2044610 RepID=A0A2P5SZ45_9GAMM|nr:DUF167 family protein [Candidatus Pantoea edessiphila]PPI87618.1 YggU family protein [Candidatus Pantoea edessiphila]
MTVMWNDENTLLINIYVKPNSNCNKIVGKYNNSIKTNIVTSPSKGKANNYLLKFLSKEFGVSKSCISIEKGRFNRYKQLRIKQPKQIPWIIVQILNNQSPFSHPE